MATRDIHNIPNRKHPNINILEIRRASSRSVANVAAGTESVTTTLLQKEGVQNLRVLSESKFQDILFRIVEERVRTALEEGLEEGLDDGAEDTNPSESAENRAEAIQEEERTHAHSELRDTYRETWQDYRSHQADRLKSLERRLQKTQEHFGSLENLVTRLFEEITLEQLSEEKL